MKTAIVLWIALALLCPIAPAQTANIDDLLARVAKWNFDQNRDDLLAVSTAVVKAHGSLAQTRDIEKRFIAFLKSDASFASKDFICRELSVMGSEASVPVLSGLLSEPKTAEIARYALERIPGPAASQVLPCCAQTPTTTCLVQVPVGMRWPAPTLVSVTSTRQSPSPVSKRFATSTWRASRAKDGSVPSNAWEWTAAGVRWRDSQANWSIGRPSVYRATPPFM